MPHSAGRLTPLGEPFHTIPTPCSARRYPSKCGEAYTLPVWLLLVQAITHATEHRTQVAAILTQQGIEPPGMDGWTYHETRYNGDWSRLWAW